MSLMNTLFFMFCVVIMIYNCDAQPARCHPDDASALIQLQLNNATQHFNQNISADCCTWVGVECDNVTGHVVRFGLSLQGDMASNTSLFSLRHLKSLFLYAKDDTAKISESAFKALARNLTRLERLGMAFIDMSSLPLASLANLSSSLTSLHFGSCRLHGEIPDDVFLSLPRLEYLGMLGNHLTGRIPRSLFNLDNLQVLSLEDNDFSNQLPEICSDSVSQNISSNCKVGILPSKLTSLSFANNFFDGHIPSWMYLLPKIEELFLSNNHFSGEIGEFYTSTLVTLHLEFNNLHGVIPRSLFQNVGLHRLDLSSNNLIGTVKFEDISKLKNLTNLDFSFNNLSISGYSKNFIGTSLEYLGLSSCHLSEIPLFLKSLTKLEALDLSNNLLQGSVPRWLWETGKNSIYYMNLSYNSLTYIHPLPWKRLHTLDLRSNLFLSHPLPVLSPKLAFFSVSRNSFSGEIPNSICNLKSLKLLDLSFNNLSGNIPQCIGNVSEELTVLDLRRNNLHGTIPTTFSIKLRSLNLNENQFEGIIPRSLANCSDLEVLDLGNNALNDTFPAWLESLPELQVLVLRANEFRGSIDNRPSQASPFLKLRIMDLSHNKFTGALPIMYFDRFEAMKVASEERAAKLNNHYMGDIFYQDSVVVTMKGYDSVLVKILTIFTTIDFSMNYFTGEIPESLGKLKALKGLNLSHNMLVSVIPSSLGNLSNLEWLDFSSNQLIGEIPYELADITSLETLNLSQNRLEGPIPQGKQFNTFGNESFAGNLNLCGFPLSKTCGEHDKTSPSNLEEEDDLDASIIYGLNVWKIVTIGFASGFVIGLSIGYMLLYSNGKLNWLSERILLELALMSARLKRSRSTLKL